jgi:hypothetical protein
LDVSLSVSTLPIPADAIRWATTADEPTSAEVGVHKTPTG